MSNLTENNRFKMRTNFGAQNAKTLRERTVKRSTTMRAKKIKVTLANVGEPAKTK